MTAYHGAMTFPWLKGHGTENDFVLLPDPEGRLHGDLSADLVAKLCHRRTGIGADGVIRVIRSEALGITSAGEWFMDYRNADGSLSEMCGNGIRVLARYLCDGNLVPDGTFVIGTRGGDRTITAMADRQFAVAMGKADLRATSVIAVENQSWSAQDVRLSNSHAVVFVDNLADAGPLVDPPKHDGATYPDGVNVEFVVRKGPAHVAMRVHERGSGETMSCGTGACAAGVVAASVDQARLPATYRVDVPGGSLRVTWQPDGEVILCGPAELVAAGEVEMLS